MHRLSPRPRHAAALFALALTTSACTTPAAPRPDAPAGAAQPGPANASPSVAPTPSVTATAAKEANDVLFLHHSCGGMFLEGGLREALAGKPYIDEVNTITYGTAVDPAAGRPDSLGAVDGDHTDLGDWRLWFNDYMASLKSFGCASGRNHIILFKSCYPNNYIGSDEDMEAKKRLFAHTSAPGKPTSTGEGPAYFALEDVFAQHPDTLFIHVTTPPLHPKATDAATARRARQFNRWLATEWVAGYDRRHPGLKNVAVLDWYDFLAVPESGPGGSGAANTLKPDYSMSADSDDSHPNETACRASTKFFATQPGNFLDKAFAEWTAARGAPGASAPRRSAPETPASK